MVGISKRTSQMSLPGFKCSQVGLEPNKTLSLDQWEDAGRKLAFLDGAIAWCIGDWLRACKGEKWGYGDLEEVCREYGFNYQTAANSKSVCDAFEFSRRRENLTFKHHAEVQGREDADKLLDWCEETTPPRPIKDLRAEKTRRDRQDRIAQELPRGTYNVLYADPPWSYGDERGTVAAGGAKAIYDLMPTDEICSMDLPKMAEDSVLFLWATVPLLTDAMQVIEAWGFQYKTHIVWDKVRPYYGNYTQVQHELLMIATSGSLVPTGDLPHSVIAIEKEKHSAKPKEFHELIEGLYPDSKRVELFAREKRKGWKTWGNQC